MKTTPVKTSVVDASSSVGATATAIRSAHEEVRRGIGACFTRLESRGIRIDEFDKRIKEKAANNAAAVQDLRRELSSLEPTEPGSTISRGEAARLEALRLSRDVAREEAQVARDKTAAAYDLARARGAEVRELVHMNTWFHAPAHRQPLAHTIRPEAR